MKHLTRFALMILVIILAACNGNDGDETATPPNAPALIEEAAKALDAPTSFQLQLDISGTPILLDATDLGLEEPLVFQRAVGTFVAPESLDATVSVLYDELTADVNVIIIGNRQFIRHQIITLNQWREENFASDFNPSSLISAETGIAQALRSIQNPTYEGETDLDGLPVHHVKGTIDASLVQSVTVGLIGVPSGQLEIDLYIRTKDGLLEQMVIKEPLKEGEEEPTTWTIGIYEYNEEHTITEPVIEATPE